MRNVNSLLRGRGHPSLPAAEVLHLEQGQPKEFSLASGWGIRDYPWGWGTCWLFLRREMAWWKPWFWKIKVESMWQNDLERGWGCRDIKGATSQDSISSPVLLVSLVTWHMLTGIPCRKGTMANNLEKCWISKWAGCITWFSEPVKIELLNTAFSQY